MRVLEQKLAIIAIGVADLQEQLSLPFSLHRGKQQNPQEVSRSEDVQLRVSFAKTVKSISKSGHVLCFHPCHLSVTVLPILRLTVHNYRCYSSFVIAMHICLIFLQIGNSLRNCRHALYIRTHTQRVGVALGVAMGVVCCEVIDYCTIYPYYFAFQRYNVWHKTCF